MQKISECILNVLYLRVISIIAIGDDYYEDDTKTIDISTEKDNKSTPLNESKHVFNNEYSNESDIDDYELSSARSLTTKQEYVTSQKKEFHDTQKSEYRKLFDSSLSNVTDFSDIKPMLNIFNEYEYNFDVNGNDTSDFENENEKLVLRKYPESKNNKRKHKSDKIKLHLIDYYTLEPASAYVTPNEGSFIRDENVWYVPEDLPCWQLPLLYGEFRNGLRAPDVFSIHRGNLKNVVYEKHKNMKFPKVKHDLESQMFNKWCEIEPCYGDHTLCMFPDKTISSFCEDHYYVLTPTSFQQVMLVNTINSMRNRIAIGDSSRYPHLPPASNMMQVTYDYDLEKMAYAWLSQCLPGPAPCSALDGNFVTQLECKKYVERCCMDSVKRKFNCTPPAECFVEPIIGCIHKWYWVAGEKLSEIDIQCGHIEAATYSTVQLLWGNTQKVGCAYGVSRNGNVRVVCDFSPGAPFYLKRKFFCGLLPYKDVTEYIDPSVDITNLTFLSSLGINLEEVREPGVKYRIDENPVYNKSGPNEHFMKSVPHWGVEALSKIYEEGWARRFSSKTKNGTRALLARVVIQYTFHEESESRCDTNEPIYIHGRAGSMCIENGRRYPALCYHYGDPTPGYRLVAILAPVILFSLVLYDLFSTAVTQIV